MQIQAPALRLLLLLVVANAACRRDRSLSDGSDGDASAQAGDASDDTSGLDAAALIDGRASRDRYTGDGLEPLRDPLGGAAGCPAGGFRIESAPCDLIMPVSGGVNTVFGRHIIDAGCGYSDASTLSFSDGREQVFIRFSEPVVLGNIGPQAPASVEIRWNSGPGATVLGWVTPPDTCSITLTADVCWYPPNDRRYKFLVSGTGTCTQPAQLVAGTGGAPITIAPFSFVTALERP